MIGIGEALVIDDDDDDDFAGFDAVTSSRVPNQARSYSTSYHLCYHLT
jgi:hypothetical protein